eukprot:GHVU01130645.1.p1 GENE.GHVU01130645.1~~GHVU01130645.1.p1  ORF type:complete len:562 (+),score=40.60 GHVU01130645.1:225-1910(+)
MAIFLPLTTTGGESPLSDAQVLSDILSYSNGETWQSIWRASRGIQAAASPFLRNQTIDQLVIDKSGQHRVHFRGVNVAGVPQWARAVRQLRFVGSAVAATTVEGELGEPALQAPVLPECGKRARDVWVRACDVCTIDFSEFRQLRRVVVWMEESGAASNFPQLVITSPPRVEAQLPESLSEVLSYLVDTCELRIVRFGIIEAPRCRIDADEKRVLKLHKYEPTEQDECGSVTVTVVLTNLTQVNNEHRMLSVAFNALSSSPVTHVGLELSPFHRFMYPEPDLAPLPRLPSLDTFEFRGGASKWRLLPLWLREKANRLKLIAVEDARNLLPVSMSKLQRISLDGSAAPNAFLDVATSCAATLRKLKLRDELNGCNENLEFPEAIPSGCFPRLEKIYFRGHSAYKAFASIAGSCHALQVLRLADCSAQECFLPPGCQFRNLRNIGLMGPDIFKFFIDWILPLTTPENIEVFQFSNGGPLRYVDLSALTNVRQLRLHASGGGSRLLPPLLNSCRRTLEEIEVHDHEERTFNPAEGIVGPFPALRRISIQLLHSSELENVLRGRS